MELEEHDDDDEERHLEDHCEGSGNYMRAKRARLDELGLLIDQQRTEGSALE